MDTSKSRSEITANLKCGAGEGRTDLVKKQEVLHKLEEESTTYSETKKA